MVLMLDLGRPDRVIVAATHYNFSSVFAWNVFLYSGMVGHRRGLPVDDVRARMNRYSKPAGVAALVWRFVLTTGTGSIFGFLVARQAYQSALLAPLFIVLSFGWGLAVFLLVQAAMYAWNGRRLAAAVQRRMARLLGVFVAASLYLVAVYHLTNLYFARQARLRGLHPAGGDGGIFPLLFWGGYVLVGTVLPLLLLFHPRWRGARGTLAAAALVVLGAFAWLFVFIIGGQAFPLEIFPGHAVSSSFADGAVALLRAALPELLLGFGGLGAAFLLTTDRRARARLPAAGRLRLTPRPRTRHDAWPACSSPPRTSRRARPRSALGLCAALARARLRACSPSRRGRTTSTRCGWRRPPAAPASTSTPT